MVGWPVMWVKTGVVRRIPYNKKLYKTNPFNQFQDFLVIPIWGNDPIWLIFLKCVASTTNLSYEFPGGVYGWPSGSRWFFFVISSPSGVPHQTNGISFFKRTTREASRGAFGASWFWDFETKCLCEFTVHCTCKFTSHPKEEGDFIIT